jgi:hypothetical protein
LALFAIHLNSEAERRTICVEIHLWFGALAYHNISLRPLTENLLSSHYQSPEEQKLVLMRRTGNDFRYRYERAHFDQPCSAFCDTHARTHTAGIRGQPVHAALYGPEACPQPPAAGAEGRSLSGCSQFYLTPSIYIQARPG